MNVVSQLWSKVSGYYRTLNPATLSGAIDVIVVMQHDGSLKSSPFHARFGKSGILRPQDNVVDIYVNGELIPDIQMKLGEAGEAFFLEEQPDDAATADGHAKDTSQAAALPDLQVTPSCCLPAKDDSCDDEDSNVSSCDTAAPDGSTAAAAGAGGTANFLEPPSAATLVPYYSDCEGDERVGAGSRRGTLTGYRSDTESDVTHGSSFTLIGGAADQLVAQMDWEWGQLPHSATMDSVKSGDYFDCCSDEAAGPAAASADAGSATIKVSGELVSSEKLNRIIVERIGNGGGSPEHSSPSDPSQQPQMQQQQQQQHQQQRSPNDRERLSSSGDVYLSDLDDSNRHIYLNGSPSSPESGYKSDQELVEEDLNVGVQLSLCGGLDLANSITTERFLKYLISYEEFVQNPDLIEHRDLVVRIQGKNYNWKTAAPIIMCRAAFRVQLPFRTVQGLKDRHMRFRRKRNTVRSWFGWGGARNAEEAEPPTEEDLFSAAVAGDEKAAVSAVHNIKEAYDEDRQGDVTKQSGTAETSARQLVRSVRLSSDQLKKLNLKPGYNEIKYSITTKFQGTTECTCAIYLWSHDDRIVISDIDGTITKSDVLGHILPMVGKDWTQPRIARLFSAIEHNDYRFVYLSARAIGQSAVTRRFLHRVRQEGVTLPDGPVLLSPLSLMRAFHQEVIARKPEAFKIACLKDVRALFPEDARPFWAGFGNRPSDALSYTEVGIEQARCFTVNPHGEVTKASGRDCLPLSYQALAEVADHVFPPFQHCFADHGSFSHFAYWRDPMPELELSEMEHETAETAAAQS